MTGIKNGRQPKKEAKEMSTSEPTTPTEQQMEEPTTRARREWQEKIDGLRALTAAFEAAGPDFPLPSSLVHVDVFVYTKARLEAARSSMPGFWQKEVLDDYFILRRWFGPIKLDLNIQRAQVCRRIVVGHKTLPAQPAQLVEVVEWSCDDLISGVIG